mgnify:CR=1 FL=1
MADRDTVIVGIGHSSLHPNATSQKLVNPGLLKLAKQDSGYDYKRNVITEYFYCRGLALMICEELSKLGLKGVTSNRYKDSDINGGSMQDRAMGAEISAINRALPSLNNPKCAINLHLNAFKANQASGAEAYCPNTEHGKILGRMLNKAVSNTLGINFRKVVPASVTTKDLPGMGFPRSVRVPGVLLELFFVDNNEDLKMADKLFANFDIKNKKCFICDLDGTLYTGDTPIQPAIDFVINSSQEFDFYFLTNNTSRAPAEYVKKLNKFGITTNEEAILSPLHILVDLIKARGFNSVYLVANTQVYNYMKSQLPEVDFDYNEEKNQAVILTYDTEINYQKLKNICLLLNNCQLEFIATHADRFCPTERGGIPDIGSMLALIEATIEKKPDMILGKPNTLLLDKLIKKYGTDKLSFVGDRLYTDKKLADNANIDFVCVLSGEATRMDIAKDATKFPAIIVDNLGELNR